MSKLRCTSVLLTLLAFFAQMGGFSRPAQAQTQTTAAAPAASAAATPSPTPTPSPSLVADSCPLRNPIYKDLRAAAAALEKKVLLPPGCEQLQKDLEDTGSQISNAAEALSKLKEAEAGSTPTTDTAASANAAPTDAANAAAQQTQLAAAVSGIMDIERIVSTYSGHERCGRALSGAMDYLEALIDTVNTLSPYLLLFGGAEDSEILGVSTPTAVLGANILGSAVKTFIHFFRDRSFDMSQTDQRNVFIENACGYHRLSQNIFSIISARKLESTQVEQRIAALRQELLALTRAEPPKAEAAAPIQALDEQLRADRRRLTEMQSLVQRIGESDEFSCFLVRSQVEASLNGEFPAGAVRALEALIGESAAAGRVVLEKRMAIGYFAQINQPSRFVSSPDPKSCGARAREWVSLVGVILGGIDSELALKGRRDQTESPVAKARAAWESRLARERAELQTIENRQKFLLQLSAQGEAIETSELFHNWTAIREALFGSERNRLRVRPRYKGPAESYLEFKDLEAERSLREFRSRIDTLNEELPRREAGYYQNAENKRYACATFGNAYRAWYFAHKHVEASLTFCNAFALELDSQSFPQISRYCLGLEHSEHGPIQDGVVKRRATQVERNRESATRIFGWMQWAGCPLPQPIQAILN